TNNRKYFTFSNIHPHQIAHLQSIINNKGIAFFIIYFKYHNTYIALEAFHIINAINNGQKSLQYDIILNIGYILKEGYQPQLDYIKFIDTLIRGE
ncbi:MAG: Holliday junction resolvase RecU, partial [Bacilli bacterium]